MADDDETKEAKARRILREEIREALTDEREDRRKARKKRDEEGFSLGKFFFGTDDEGEEKDE